jgi:hypothetical protein
MLKQARTRLSLGLCVNYSGKRLPPGLRIISAPAESVTVAGGEAEAAKRKGWQSGSPGHREPSEPGNSLLRCELAIGALHNFPCCSAVERG